jgi:hypothetical protein
VLGFGPAVLAYLALFRIVGVDLGQSGLHLNSPTGVAMLNTNLQEKWDPRTWHYVQLQHLQQFCSMIQASVWQR